MNYILEIHITIKKFQLLIIKSETHMYIREHGMHVYGACESEHSRTSPFDELTDSNIPYRRHTHALTVYRSTTRIEMFLYTFIIYIIPIRKA